MRTEAEMKCDVCGCVTDHLTPIAGRWCLASERDAAIARADAAEQMVAELRAVLVRRHAHDVAGGICDTPERCSCDDDVTAILEQAAPIAGRWVSRSAYDEALNAIMEGDKRLEAAIARAQKAEAELAQRPEATGL